jgi:hypothetical protein
VAKDEYDPIQLDRTDLDFRVDTNPDEVRRFIQRDTGDIKVVFSTYHSSPVVSAGVRGLAPFDVAIFDEAHRTTGPKGSLFAHCLSEENITKKALITNARCLTEGVDVPAVDMVAFIDPRHSKIDIAQATGRAMRKPRGSDKTLGYIVVPLFLERKGEETLENALERSDFSDVADVLNALQEQDEDLIAIVRELQEAKGRGEVFNPKRLAEKVEVLGLTIDLSELKSNIFAEIVDRIGVSWDERFGALLRFKEREGHCRVKGEHVEGAINLGNWVDVQRQTKATMSADRRRRLDEIGFDWDPLESQWEEGFGALTRFKAREGHCNVPKTYIEETFNLGTWVHWQRKKRMPVERRQRLDEIGFVWNTRESRWAAGFAALKKFKTREGHCRVPFEHTEDGFNLGMWVNNLSRHTDYMSAERRQQLDAIGFIPSIRMQRKRVSWEGVFAALMKFNTREGHCRVPFEHTEDGYKLGKWVNKQRSKRDMPADRRQRLDAIGFAPAKHIERALPWDECYGLLLQFKAREGHCRVPVLHVEGTFKLGQWARAQRRYKDTMRAERRQRLDQIGFVWDPLEETWEEGFAALKKFKAREGHCRVPKSHTEGSFRLGQWVGVQRSNRDTMPAERKRRLDEIGFFWDPYESAWEEGFAALMTFKAREGHCRMPTSQIEGSCKLGQWVRRQRENRDTMPADLRQRVDEIGFVWRSERVAVDPPVRTSGA